jgi:hypothetical protein
MTQLDHTTSHAVTTTIKVAVGGAGMGLSIVDVTALAQAIGAITGAIVGIWMLYDKVISLLDKLLGYPTLIVGLVVDTLVNILIVTILLFELPQLQRGELLVTPRIKRLAALPQSSKGLAKWRRLVSRWLLGQIDQHDKTGGHNVPKDF